VFRNADETVASLGAPHCGGIRAAFLRPVTAVLYFVHVAHVTVHTQGLGA
jgi:hypothetical protein